MAPVSDTATSWTTISQSSTAVVSGLLAISRTRLTTTGMVGISLMCLTLSLMSSRSNRSPDLTNRQVGSYNL